MADDWDYQKDSRRLFWIFAISVIITIVILVFVGV